MSGVKLLYLIHSHGQAWEPCLKIDGKLNCFQNENRMMLFRMMHTSSRGFLTFWTQSPPLNLSPTCDCTMRRVEAVALSARRGGCQGEYALREVIIHISASPWKQASPYRGWNLFLSFCFLFSSEASRFGKWEISNEEIHSKRDIQNHNLLLSQDDSYTILMQNLNHTNPSRL